LSGTAAEERRAFADACDEVGPDASTLCGGWTTADLAAHCYVREHRLDAMPGVLPLGPLSSYTEKVMSSVLRVHGFDKLVDAVRTAPPWLPGPLDDAVNTAEYFVHTEDVRRPNGLPQRETSLDLERFVWRRLRRQARLSFRRVQATVRLMPSTGEAVTVGRGGPAVEVSGKPTELLLLAYNRKEQADLDISGNREALMAAHLGL
jgi:uncharacterized protein (TIGR03085 family)